MTTWDQTFVDETNPVTGVGTRFNAAWANALITYIKYLRDTLLPGILVDAVLTGTPVAPTAAVGTDTTQIATCEFVQDELGVVFEDAALTGTPTAPTAADPATDTTQIATCAFVQDVVASLTTQLNRNAIINGGCRVNQYPNAFTLIADEFSLDHINKAAGIDRFEGCVSGPTVSAGTFGQSTTATAGSTGYAAAFTGVTTTGATAWVHLRYRMEAKDAVQFKNKTASFSCSVYHDKGSALTYGVEISKANSADNFAAVTSIGIVSLGSVPSGAKTALAATAISMGDCSNGIQIDIMVNCGVVTSKLFEFAEIQFEVGDAATPFEHRPYAQELALCQRYAYCQKGIDAYWIPHSPANLLEISGASVLYIPLTLPAKLRHTPDSSHMVFQTVTIVSTTPDVGQIAVRDLAAATHLTATGGSLGLVGAYQTKYGCNVMLTYSVPLTGGTVGDPCVLAVGADFYALISAEL